MVLFQYQKVTVKQHSWHIKEAVMEINHTKNLIPDIWEKRKAISVQEKNEHSQHVFDMSWLLLSTRNYTVSHCEAWHNNINYGEETEDLLNSAHQHLKFTFFIKQNTYEIITFRQRKLNPCILKENCCIETKDWINWIVRSTCLSQNQMIDVWSIRIH